MNIRGLLLGAAIAALSATAANASITVNFDDPGLGYGSAVDGFYSGEGVTFNSGDWFVLNGYQPSSPPQFAYNYSGNGFVDVASGFTSLSFFFGAFSDTTISVYSGAGGTGSLLGQTTVSFNNPNNSPFTAASVSFAGTGHSAVISSGLSQFAWDDVTFGGASGAPEPATWGLMVAGFGGLGVALRRRREPEATAA
jgi:hypothetical protein